jgi:Flp pilus assembly protein TadB
MTGPFVLIAAMAVAAALVAAPVRCVRPGRRLARLTGGAPGRPRLAARPDRVRSGAVLLGIAVAVLAGGWWGLPLGVAAAFVADRGLRRLEPSSARARRLREAADLPLVADLLAVALRGGTPVDRAAAAVATAVPAPLGDRLQQAARLLELGATPAEAWDQLATVAGADRVIRAAVRSADHGGALAGALSRLAEDLRADRAAAAEATARRSAVLIVLPLGLCFLPAFVLAGLVPVIIAVLGDVVHI